MNISTSPFHLDLWGEKFQVYVAKVFLFSSVAHAFRIAQKLQNPNLQCRYGHKDNSECETVLRNFPITLSRRSMFTFAIIKSITKFGFRFPNVGEFTTNFTF